MRETAPNAAIVEDQEHAQRTAVDAVERDTLMMRMIPVCEGVR